MDLDVVLASLTLDEKASLTAGADMWNVLGIPGKGIPTVTLTDGPNGARGSALLGAGRVTAACLPCGSALGASWDPGLVEEVGAVLGEEARTKSARFLLAPTVNLPRSPLYGRSFECYSEDPLLSGLLAAGFVRGLQSRGVAATLKHLIANEAEFERTTISSQVDERALHELYLVPFEIAIREAGALAVMTSYNRLNGTWCGEDPDLLTTVLRDEFGFDGVVMSDWFAVGSTVGSSAAGMDLQMPGPGRFFGAQLAEAVRDGRVHEAVLDTMVGRWLSVVDRLGAWDDVPAPEMAADLPAHRAVSRRAAVAGTVLLTNDGLLPLSGMESIALIGPNAVRAHIMGGGSAQLRAHRIVTLAEVLQNRLPGQVVLEPGCLIDKTIRPLSAPFETTFRNASGDVVGVTTERDGRMLWFESPLDGLDPEHFTFTAKASVVAGVSGQHRITLVQAGRATVSVDGVVVLDGVTEVPPAGQDLFGLGSIELEAFVDLTAGQQAEVVIDYASTGAVVLRGVKVGFELPPDSSMMDRAVAAAAAAHVAVLVVGTSDEWESEGHDRDSLHLPGDQDELVRRVCAANPRTVVVVNAGAPVQLDWAREAGAVLVPWLGGEQMADALADVLLGVSEPSGRLPVTLPLRIEHTPAYGAFPGANHTVSYGESLLAGYRWYDSRFLPTAFPFGHGLSYTSFSWGTPSLVVDGERVVVEVTVTNSGDRPGSEVVQAYVEPPLGPLFRPRRELKGFAKLALAPGESGVARVVLGPRAFSCWDPGSTETTYLTERLGDGVVVPASGGPVPSPVAGWRTQPGTYLVHLARSVADVVATVELARG